MPKEPRLEVYRDKRGDLRWRVRAANGLVLATSSEGYRRIGDVLNALNLVATAMDVTDEEVRALVPKRKRARK